MIISHLAGRPDVWSRMASPPQLVSKGNVMIGYSPVYENAALPDAARVAEAVRRSLSATQPRAAERAARAADAPQSHEGPRPAPAPAAGPPEVVVTLPIMGEGIRAARIVALAKKPGEAVAREEAICEVETEKAVYPIEASASGVLKEWRCRVDDTVDVGREIAVITVGAAAHAPGPPAPQQGQEGAPARHPAPARGTVVPPVLPAPITRRVAAVVPANMQLDARWEAIRTAREAAKRANRNYSPSLMLGWCITRSMVRHAAFRRLVLKDGSIVERTDFDLGIAVALDGDRLATAALHGANSLDWAGFAAAYAKAVADTRAGTVEDVQAPLNITSLGAFGIEQAVPIVVPPAMGTLFIGRAHERLINDNGSIYPAEVATLSLTFDHKVVNGAGAAAFLHDVVAEVESFRLPDLG
jgi:pyruvate/2-oxoglutarate dehydrogenase complex dihydrolipoamide acyltransferase (E2) component